ncbi:hypothetical protein [Novilysobacter selenitireducens]|uniref:PepSY domain-containing protein n=1 Tax=Novilysobacter selenitireducens TaxID=2872639 RepID=A0ABS7T5I1_9GAMM|nr:hypothetical protein [Lysobacter selenitireducens]MBZ4039106.1 hypothetical protein [Lysobacter selenitireducens]
MHDSLRLIRACLATTALLLAGDALAQASNKWRLQVHGGADSDGVVVLQATPDGLPPQEVTVRIAAGTRENNVARAIRDALRGQWGAAYHVETDDGEDVLVKKRRGAPDFALRVSSETVRGMRITLDRE